MVENAKGIKQNYYYYYYDRLMMKRNFDLASRCILSFVVKTKQNCHIYVFTRLTIVD